MFNWVLNTLLKGGLENSCYQKGKYSKYAYGLNSLYVYIVVQECFENVVSRV